MSGRSRIAKLSAPILSFLRSRAAAADIRSIDFEQERLIFLEEITGVEEDGVQTFLGASLQENLAPSIPRIRALRQSIEELVELIREDPEAYGVTLEDLL